MQGMPHVPWFLLLCYELRTAALDIRIVQKTQSALTQQHLIGSNDSNEGQIEKSPRHVGYLLVQERHTPIGLLLTLTLQLDSGSTESTLYCSLPIVSRQY